MYGLEMSLFEHALPLSKYLWCKTKGSMTVIYKEGEVLI